MKIEGKCALLSVRLQDNHNFVRKPQYLQDLQVILTGAGIETTQITPNVVWAQFGPSSFPVVAVTSEDFFTQINPVPKYRVANMGPHEWVQNKLIAVNKGWANDSIIADATLQALLFQERFDRKSGELDTNELPDVVSAVVRRFVAQGLDLYRQRWYEWLELGM